MKAAGEKAEMEPGVLGRGKLIFSLIRLINTDDCICVARDPDALPSKSALEKFSLKVASGVGFSGLLRMYVRRNIPLCLKRSGIRPFVSRVDGSCIEDFGRRLWLR